MVVVQPQESLAAGYHHQQMTLAGTVAQDGLARYETQAYIWPPVGVAVAVRPLEPED